MDLVNLKTGTDSFQDEKGETHTRDDYPWGLCISLDNETLSKLGVATPTVGGVVMIMAKAIVKSTSERQDDDGTYRRAELQITDMGIAPDSSEQQKTAAQTLYGGEDD
ncbi:capsid staple protein [Citrobacter sp. Cb028]|uniref:capsid staple protein n=1 Tax=Citrobacter sp. Cb028 TaxID=2985024 RepID=UPI002577F350|nr:hypothetical protein [Citrobacter sp. Cb028]MDM3455730.1 hypothetical protein [Citrobacter sp. Cb028]HBV7426222.1 hypothetical protein [Citrobacter freundii]